MKKLFIILILILTLCSCNKTSDTNQGEPEKFKLRMNNQRYISEADETIRPNSRYDSIITLDDCHNLYFDINDDYELKSISLLSIDETVINRERVYVSNEVQFNYNLSSDKLNIDLDKNYVWTYKKILILNFIIDFNGEHNFRIRIKEKPLDDSEKIKLFMNNQKYVVENDRRLNPVVRYYDLIRLEDYHNLYFDINDCYEIENISLRSYAILASGPEKYDYDEVQFEYNIKDNKLEIEVDENYILDWKHDLILSLKVEYSGEHFFDIGIMEAIVEE